MTLKERLHEIVEAPVVSDPVSHYFKVTIITLIVASVLSVILETVSSVNAAYGKIFAAFELATVLIFSAELVVRLWVCVVEPRYSHPLWGRLKFVFTPGALIDIVAVLPFYLPIVGFVDLRFVRALRLLRLLRLFEGGRYTESADLLAAVIRGKKEELAVTTGLALVLLVVVSSLMYFVENGAQPKVFSSIPAAMWWGVATLTTIGYGDIYPITPLGKLLAGISGLLGIGMFALPAGILGSAFVTEMQKRHAPPPACPHCGKSLS
jgi:voltage-gated potassium channel